MSYFDDVSRALDVECRYCGAPKGIRCQVRTTHKSTDPHAARIEDAKPVYTEEDPEEFVAKVKTVAIAGLRKALSKVQRDQFPVGEVIRWTSADRYTYAAIKTPVGWYTTSNNCIVEKMMDYEELVETLGRDDVTDVQIAKEWETL